VRDLTGAEGELPGEAARGVKGPREVGVIHGRQDLTRVAKGGLRSDVRPANRQGGGGPWG